MIPSYCLELMHCVPLLDIERIAYYDSHVYLFSCLSPAISRQTQICSLTPTHTFISFSYHESRIRLIHFFVAPISASRVIVKRHFFSCNKQGGNSVVRLSSSRFHINLNSSDFRV
jgi:hypothetical protein